MATPSTPSTPSTRRVLVRLFDIRNIVGALLAIYGVLLTIAGFVPALLHEHDTKAATNDKVDLYVGTAANWWVGLVLLAVAVAEPATELMPRILMLVVPGPTGPPDTVAPALNDTPGSERVMSWKLSICRSWSAAPVST